MMTNDLIDYSSSFAPTIATDKKKGLGKPKMPRKELLRLVAEDLESSGSDKERLLKLRYWSERNLFVFCIFVLNLQYINNDFGYRLCWEVQRKKYGRLWIIAREHYKSTIITFASTLWEICKEPNNTYCIYSYKADIASAFLCQIKDEIERNDLLRYVWSDVFWENPTNRYEMTSEGMVTWKWTTTEITVKRTINCKECTLSASGLVSGQLTGYHFSHLIYDDAETFNSVKTVDGIAQLKDAFSVSLNTGQANNRNYVIIGTYYALNDLYIHIEKDGIAELVLQPCFWKDGTPARFTKEQLEITRKAMGSATFAVQMLCNPREGSKYAFNEAWIEWWPADTWQGMNIYILVDPAGKVARKRDNTAMWVVGIDFMGNFMVLDLIRDKLNMAGKALALNNLVRKYSPIQVYYERVGMQSDIDYLRKVMSINGYYYGISEVIATAEKGMRIDKLGAFFEDHKIFLPLHTYHKNWEGKQEDMIQSFLEDEYKCYPSTLTDDALDSLSMMIPLYLSGNLAVPKERVQDKRFWRGHDHDIDNYSEPYDSMANL